MWVTRLTSRLRLLTLREVLMERRNILKVRLRWKQVTEDKVTTLEIGCGFARLTLWLHRTRMRRQVQAEQVLSTMGYVSGTSQNFMEGRGNVVTIREVTKEWNSPVEQGNTKEGVQEEKNRTATQASIDRSLGKKEQKRNKGVVLQRWGKRHERGKKL